MALQSRKEGIGWSWHGVVAHSLQVGLAGAEERHRTPGPHRQVIGGERSAPPTPLQGMRRHDPQDQLASLVDAFLCCMGQLMLICDHMTRHPAPEDADPAPVVLRRLLCEVLEPDLAHHTADCATVTRVIKEVSARIDSDLCLVEPEVERDL